MPASEEDALVQIAVNESLQTKSPHPLSGQTSSADQAMDEGIEEGPSPRVTIDDMIGRLASRATAELPGFDDPEGDTWIFIDAAPKQPEQDQVDYEHYVKFCSAPIQLKKTTLMSLNSPIINGAFAPTIQYRLLRRRKLVGKLPQSIKYVIDLTPPSEGDDAVWLISSLSCSEGVRLWYHAEQVFAVSSQLVGGEEEYFSSGPNANGDRLAASHNPFQIGHSQSKIAPEYSPIRHRTAIKRLLATAAGGDPKLDSAVKLWTTFAVARHFGAIHSPLTDYIVTWLQAYPNCQFLEVLTETSHIMADQLQLYNLERDTFAMLVGEESLDSMLRLRNQQRHHERSTFGRIKDDLPEHIQTRVEYASKAFTERITADFEELKAGSWIESIAEFQRLSSFTHPELQHVVTKLKNRLKDFVRGTILHVQCSKYETIPSPDVLHSQPGAGKLIPQLNRKTIFDSLYPSDRILTRTFWNALESLDLFGGQDNLDILPAWDHTAVLKPVDVVQIPILPTYGYQKVEKSSLYSAINVGQAALDDLQSIELQPKEIYNTGKFLTPERSSSFVPLEVSKRFPLAIRFKKEQNSDYFVPKTDPLNDENANFNDRIEARANLRQLNLPAPKGLDGWPLRDIIPERWDDYDVSNVGPLTTNHEPEKQSVEGNGLTMPVVVAEKEDAWGRSYIDGIFGDEHTVDTSDTAPLLSQTDDQSGLGPFTEMQQAEFSPLEESPIERPYPPPPPKSNNPDKIVFFNLTRFFDQVQTHIHTVARLKLSYTDSLNGRNEPHKIDLLNTLVCLDEPEFKYLPLWAGGCDDDSGGVFNDDVTMPDVSFATAGPNIQHGAAMHTVSECDTVSENGAVRGIATPTSSAPSSEYHLIKAADAASISTITPSSNNTTAGYFTDKLASDQVYAASSIDDDSSSISNDFSFVARSEGMNSDDEEAIAQREIAALERAEAKEEADMMAAAAAAAVARNIKTEPESDENYADLFGSECGDDGVDYGEEGEGGYDSDETMQDFDDDDDGDECGSEGELV